MIYRGFIDPSRDITYEQTGTSKQKQEIKRLNKRTKELESLVKQHQTYQSKRRSKT